MMQTQVRNPGAVVHQVTQRIEDFPDIKVVRDETRAFASNHVKALAVAAAPDLSHAPTVN